MAMKIDPGSISLGAHGEVIIDSAELRERIEKSALGASTNATTNPNCNGNNLSCNNTSDCRGSTNSGSCSNSGRCFSKPW